MNLKHFSSSSFDLIIDKGTLDAIASGSDGDQGEGKVWSFCFAHHFLYTTTLHYFRDNELPNTVKKCGDSYE